jgi:hypothetical protein
LLFDGDEECGELPADDAIASLDEVPGEGFSWSKLRLGTGALANDLHHQHD